MQNVNVTNLATEILPAGKRSGAAVLMQNQSDTQMRLAFGSNVGALAAGLGYLLEPGDAIVIDGQAASRAVSAIHGGAGNKVLHWQLV